jgi:hypothetical protein
VNAADRKDGDGGQRHDDQQHSPPLRFVLGFVHARILADRGISFRRS